MDKTLVIVIMAHGIFGWGENGTGTRLDQTKDYYYGVQKFLEAEYGSRPDLKLVLVAPTVPAAESVEGRGAKLKESIESELKTWPPGTRAHIVAHSMGGLDARWVIAQEGMAEKIASLTTIATPHRGTTLGDLAYDELPIIMPAMGFLDTLYKIRRLIWRHLPFTRMARADQLEFYHHLLSNFTGSSQDQIARGLYALTLDGAAEFNRKYEAAERRVRERTDKPVRYFAYGGRSLPKQTDLLKPSYEIMRTFGTKQEKQCNEESCNDGAVSIWSAHFPWDDAGNDYVKAIPFDHFMQINWRIPDKRPSDEMSNDLKAVYREIMENILRVQRAQQPA